MLISSDICFAMIKHQQAFHIGAHILHIADGHIMYDCFADTLLELKIILILIGNHNVFVCSVRKV
jgi:hypothetical protein